MILPRCYENISVWKFLINFLRESHFLRRLLIRERSWRIESSTRKAIHALPMFTSNPRKPPDRIGVRALGDPGCWYISTSYPIFVPDARSRVIIACAIGRVTFVRDRRKCRGRRRINSRYERTSRSFDETTFRPCHYERGRREESLAWSTAIDRSSLAGSLSLSLASRRMIFLSA